MLAWQIPAFGLDALELVERSAPQPGPGQVLIRIHAVSLNFRDLRMVTGLYNPKLEMPRVPCSDGAGEIVALGEGVANWQVGDRVAGIFMQNWLGGELTAAKSKGALGGDIDGMLAEYVVLSAEGIVPLPPHLSYEEAATLPCAAVTAWNALFRVGKIRPANTVLILGTGGVSIFALQLAKIAGARVLGISSSDEKLERAKALGLDAGCNYRANPDWEKWVAEQTDGQGVDLVVEVGGAGTLARSLKAVRFGGAVAMIGVLSGVEQPIPLPAVLHKQIRVEGVYVGSRLDFLEMNNAIAQWKLRPVGEAFHWDHAREALRRMEAGAHFGKIVLSAMPRPGSE